MFIRFIVESTDRDHFIDQTRLHDFQEALGIAFDIQSEMSTNMGIRSDAKCGAQMFEDRLKHSVTLTKYEAVIDVDHYHTVICDE